MKDRVPDLLVERLALGELGAAEAREVRERLGDDVDLRLEAIQRSNAEILEAHSPGDMAVKVQRRLEAQAAATSSRSRAWWYGFPTLAAAAGLLLWIGTRGPEQVAQETGRDGDVRVEKGDGLEGTVLKGDARLVIQRRRGTAEVRLEDGDRVRAGDLLQLSYDAGGDAEGVIVSLDGRGVVTLHHPQAPGGETALASGGRVSLAQAYELDDAPRFERFFFVTGEDVDVGGVTRAVVSLGQSRDPRAGALELPEAWRQSSLLLRKE